MKASFTAVLALFLLAASAYSALPRGRFHDVPLRGVPPQNLTVRLMRLPTWLLLLPLKPFLDEPERETGILIAREDGWARVGFPLRDRGLGVYIKVTGRAQLGRVEIVFEDGGIQSIELRRNTVYRRGLYRLASFDADRVVMLVRTEARARSPRAEMRVLLAR